MTALMESFLSTSIHNVFSWPILTFLHFSQVGKPVLDSSACSFHLTPLPHVGYTPNGRTDPSISSTTPCGTCPACLAMSGQAPNSQTDPFISSTTLCGMCPTCLAMSCPLMELFMFQPCLGPDCYELVHCTTQPNT